MRIAESPAMQVESDTGPSRGCLICIGSKAQPEGSPPVNTLCIHLTYDEYAFHTMRQIRQFAMMALGHR